jgi:uncharacterized protein YggE
MDPALNQTYAAQTPQKPSFMDHFGSMDLRKKGLGLLGIAIAVVVLGFLWTWTTSPMIITVNGIGEVSVPAEAATLSFTVQMSSGTAQGAIDQVKNSANALTQILKGTGVSDTDIAEAQVTVIPAGSVSQAASGYIASITMAAKTTDVAKVNSLIATLYGNGVTLVSQPILSVEKKDELEKKALDLAIKDAKKQAGDMAWKNLKPIRKIISITQASSSSTSTATSKADATTQAENLGTENGVFKIVKAVSISYKMW